VTFSTYHEDNATAGLGPHSQLHDVPSVLTIARTAEERET